jgi:2'-5' RNA ligase
LLGYYWFLTFEHSPALHSLVQECQAALDYAYYDQVSTEGLHLTLDRIAQAGDISQEQLEQIQAAVVGECKGIEPPKIAVGKLGRTSGAIGLNVASQDLYYLRETVRTVTAAVYPDAKSDSTPFYPHVTIAYANADGVPAMEAAAAIERINGTTRQVRVTVTEVVMVQLERREGAYAWEIVSRISLGG